MSKGTNKEQKINIYTNSFTSALGGSAKVGGRTFQVIKDATSSANAKATCESRGSKLATISCQAELDDLR